MKLILGVLGLTGLGILLMSNSSSAAGSKSSPPKPSGNGGGGSLPEPYDWGVPFAAPTGVVWPVQGGSRIIAYRTTSGRGPGGTGFGAPRADPPGAGRKHAANDLDAHPPNKIVAAEDGVISAIILNQYVMNQAKTHRLDAVVVKSANHAILYGEINRAPGLKVGDHVKAGQLIGSAAWNYVNNSMLHMEMWDAAHAPTQFNQWIGKTPTGLLDPTKYLIALAAKDPK